MSVDQIRSVLDFYRENRLGVDAYIAACRVEMAKNLAAYQASPQAIRMRSRIEAHRLPSIVGNG